MKTPPPVPRSQLSRTMDAERDAHHALALAATAKLWAGGAFLLGVVAALIAVVALVAAL